MNFVDVLLSLAIAARLALVFRELIRDTGDGEDCCG